MLPTTEELQAEMEQKSSLALEIMERDPKLGYINAFIMASDQVSMERSKRWVIDGILSFMEAMPFVGSYGRLDFVLWGIEHGHVTHGQISPQLCGLWRGSDPDDTDPRMLELWQDAWAHNTGPSSYIRDGGALPREKLITIYRGQDEQAPRGIAWTTNYDIACKFANGAATRQHNRGGVILVGKAHRGAVMAYITGRGEDEVIVDPRHVQTVGVDRPGRLQDATQG